MERFLEPPFRVAWRWPGLFTILFDRSYSSSDRLGGWPCACRQGGDGLRKDPKCRAQEEGRDKGAHGDVRPGGHRQPAKGSIRPEEGGTPFTILSLADDRPAAVLYLHRDRPLMGREEEMRGALNEMYDLSPVEADIALSLSRGRTMTQLAGDLGLSENTIRSYSKPIYAKLGVSRQVDLVRLALTSLARLA